MAETKRLGPTQLKVETLKDGAMIHVEWIDEARCDPVEVAATGFEAPATGEVPRAA